MNVSIIWQFQNDGTTASISVVKQTMDKKEFPLKTTIEIDCDPWTGMGRQQDHYEHICRNIVGCEPQSRISACFGCWEWPITYQNQEQQDKTAEFLKDLYNKGLCRYASW